jgi:mannose-1-phosphate guanylyltransferase
MSGRDQDLVVVIMAGGVGTRFWPLSTETRPKQFLRLFDDRSLLQMSYDRVSDLVSPDRILVLTNEMFVPLVGEQLPDIPSDNIVGEPMRRDTAAAVTLAALLCRHRFGNPVMAILTADHMIEPVSLFQKTLLSAMNGAIREEGLYTFGIAPTYPATGYGYLERGEKTADDNGIEHFKLLQFKEKPDKVTARSYVESGRYLWNSGMFVWKTDVIMAALNEHLQTHVERLASAISHYGTARWPTALREAFEPLPCISIDFGVMEKVPRVYGVASQFSWDDVGGWLSLCKYVSEDETGNRCFGQTMTLDSANNLIFCEEPKGLVALVGVDDLVVVRSKNATLIVHKDRTEEVKKLVEQMEESEDE